MGPSLTQNIWPREYAHLLCHVIFLGEKLDHLVQRHLNSNIPSSSSSLCHAIRLPLGAMTSFWPLVPRHPSHLLYRIVLSTPKLFVSLHGVHAFLREGEHPASSQAGHMHGHWNHCIPTTPLLLGPYTQKRGHMSGHSPAETLPIPTITLATHTCSTSV